MADPAGQFQPISAPYQFQGHVYNPPGVNVPSNAGEIMAEAGRTALGVGQMMQNSPLFDPAKRAQMQLDVANAHQGLNYLDQLNKSGLGPYTIGIDPNGRAYTVPLAQIQNPTIQGAVSRMLNKGQKVYPSTDDGSGTGDGSGTDQQKKEQDTTKPPTPKEMGTTQAGPSKLFASTPRTAPPAYDPTAYRTGAVATPGNQFVSSESGIPAGWKPQGAQDGGGQPQYFLNPATGSYEPVQQGAPPEQAAPPQQQQAAPQAQAEPGGMMDQYARDYAAGHAQGQAARQQQDLSNWQQQTIHPVVGTQEALKWFKANRTTLATDATYLDNGGPGGQPAYAFHMKGGGTNIVPVAQMVKAGFGPTVAANNQSVALSQTDQLQQQQQNALGAPPAPAAPSGAVASDQGGPQGGPPPAPGAPPQPPTGGYQQIASDQGGPPIVQGAPGTGYDPMAVRQAIAQYAQSPENLTASTGQQGQPAAPQYGPDSRKITDAPQLTPQQQNAVKQAEQNKDINSFQGDTGFTWNRDTQKTLPDGRPNKYYGKMYASLPGTSGNYFDEQRFYQGTDGYHLYENPETEQRKEMQYWIDAGRISRDKVAGMKSAEMEPWLRQKFNNLNYQRTPATEGINSSLDGMEDLHNTMVQIQDGVKKSQDFNWLDKGAVALHQAADDLSKNSPNDEKSLALVQNAQDTAQRFQDVLKMPEGPEKDQALAQVKTDLANIKSSIPAPLAPSGSSPMQRVGNAVSGLLNWFTGTVSSDTISTVRGLERNISHAHQLLAAHPEWQLLPGQAGGLKLPNVNLWGATLGLPNIPATDVLDDVFRSVPPEEKLKNLAQLQQFADKRYGTLVGNAQTQWQRFDDKHVANVTKYAEENKAAQQPSATASPAPSATPSPTPTMKFDNSNDVSAFMNDKRNSGKRFQVWSKKQNKYIDMEAP